MRGLNNIPNLLNKDNVSDEKPGNFVINDIQLHVPPTAISVHKEGLHYSMKALRTNVTTKILSGSGVYHAQVKVTFPQDSILLLHRLICEIKNSPFVSIQNKFISDSMGKDLPGTYSGNLNHMSFTVMGLQVQNHPSSANAFLCELDLRYFNHKPYTRFFGFKKEFLNKVDGKYFTHKVFDYEFEKSGRIKIDFEEKNTETKKSIRALGKKYTSYNTVNNVQSTLFVADGRRSNAYKRYANYLQSKALFENFGIQIRIKKGEEASSNVINISSTLYHSFEKGSSSGNQFPKVFGLHELVNINKPGIFEESVSFRNALIKAMLVSSREVKISYKEFLKYVGDADFMRRYDNSLNKGIAAGNNQTEEQKKNIREKNRKQIDERFINKILELNSENITESSKERELNKINSFYQIKASERFPEGTLEKQKNSQGIEREFYPLTLNASYEKIRKDLFKVKSLNNIESSISVPLFCPFDFANIKYASKKIIISTEENYLEFIFNDEQSFSSLKDFNLKIEEGNKGDIVGYSFPNEDILVNTNVDLIEAYKKVNVGGMSLPPKQDKIVFGELRESDIEEFKKYKKEFFENGYKVNSTRVSATQVLEKVTEANFGFVILDEAIDILTGTKAKQVFSTVQPTVVTNISGGVRHIMASIPVIGLQEPTHQFLGSIEPNYQLSFIGKDSGIGTGGIPTALKELESIRNLMMYNAKNFSYIPDSGNLYVSSFITKLLGSEKIADNVFSAENDVNEFYPNIVMSSADTFTVEGSPEVTGMHVRFSESKSYTEEKLAPARSTNIDENVYEKILGSYKFVKKSSPSNNEAEENVFTSLPSNGKDEYLGLKNWKTKDFNSVSWYRKSTNTGRAEHLKWEKNNEDHKKLDNNGFLFCKEYLQPLQDFLTNYGNVKNKKPFKIKLKSTFDFFGKSHRSTRSNHFANVAADIYVPGLNVMELASIIYRLTRGGFIKGKELREDQFIENSSYNCGIGIYGKQAHIPNTAMSEKGVKSNGFLHLDANFNINTNGGFTYSPFKKSRRWVGESKNDAFRTQNHDDYTFTNVNTNVYYYNTVDGTKDAETKSLIRQSRNKFWGFGNVTFDQSYLKIIITNNYNTFDEALTALERQHIISNENDSAETESVDDAEENEIEGSETDLEKISGKQESTRSKDILYSKNALADKFDINVSELTMLSANDIEDKQILNSSLNNSNKNDYSYIKLPSFRDPNSFTGFGTMRIGEQLKKIKKELSGTAYIVVQDNIKTLNDRVTKSGFDGFILALPKAINRNRAKLAEQKAILRKNKQASEKALDSFQLLASIVLTEPHLYTKDEEEAKAELERINKLLGLDVVPSLYNCIEAGLLRTSHLGGGLVETIEKGEYFDTNTLYTVLELGAAGTMIKSGASILASSGASILGATTALPLLPFVLIGGGVILGAGAAFSAFSEGEDFALQAKRIKLLIAKSSLVGKKYQTNYYINMLKLISFYKKHKLTTSISESELESIQDMLGDALTIENGINRYFKLLFSKNPAFKYFEQMADDIGVDSELSSLLNYKASEMLSDENPQKFIGNSLILGGGILKEYLRYLFEFPLDADNFLGVADYLDPDETASTDVYDVEDDKVTIDTFFEGDLKYADGVKYGSKKNLFEAQVKDDKVSLKDFFTSERKQRLKFNQEEKLKWLQSILKNLLETRLLSDDDPEVQELRHQLETSLNVFDSDTYPDIIVPNNPMLKAKNKKLEPSFFYWDTKELNLKRKASLFKRSKDNAKNILKNSMEFEKALTQGIYTGPKRINEKNEIHIEGGAEDDNETKSNRDIQLHNMDNYLFRDKFDNGVQEEISSEEFKEVVSRNITAPAATIDNIKNKFKNIVKEMEGESGNIVLNSTGGLSNSQGIENLNDFSLDEGLKLSEEAFDHFYGNDDMLKAYPTFKLYLVEEDEEVSDKIVAFDDFYYYNSVIGFRFHNSRELPAQTATIQLQNISGTLDGTKKIELRDIDVVRDSRKLPYGSDDNIVVDSIVLRPGINVQLRAGYGSHSSDLSVLLNGAVTEVNYSSDNMVANITVQSFGVELDKELKNTYAEGNNYTFNSTAEVLASLSYSEELRHFGRIKKGKIFPFGESSGRNVLDIENINEDVSYTYSLFKGGLDFFERNAKAIAIGMIILDLAGPLVQITKFKFPGLGKVLDTSGSKIAKTTKEMYENAGLLTKIVGSPFLFAKKTYDVVNRLVGRNFYKTNVGDKAAWALKGANEAGVNNRLLVANLTKYEINRALGAGILKSRFLSLFGKTVQVTDDVIRIARFKSIYQKQGYAAALTYLETAGTKASYGYGTYTSLLFANRTTGGYSLGSFFFNQFNIVPKVSAITAGAFLAALYGGGLGAIGDGFSYVFGTDERYAFQRRMARLKKRVILSPIDDNLFPPLLDSYARENPNEITTLDTVLNFLGSSAKNLMLGLNFTTHSLVGGGKKVPSIEELIKSKIKLSNKFLSKGKETNFIISNQSVWNVLKELTYRHPGFIYGIRPYGEQFEYRMFFGKPNQRYYSSSLTNSEASRLQNLRVAIESLGNDNALHENDCRTLYKDIWSKFSESDKDTTQKELAKIAIEEFILKTKKRFTPFRKYHSVSSHKNLISNNLVTSGHNVINTVQVHTYMGDDDYVGEPRKDEVYTVTMKASQNIPRELERSKTLQMLNIRGIGNANRYGIAELLYNTKEMYTGSLLVLGNAKINPWDVVILNDRVNDINGPLEVKSITHTFSHETGFLTDIEVNAIVCANDFFTMPMLQQVFVHEARKNILEEYNSRGELGLSGNKVKDKEILREQVLEAIENMNEEDRSIIDSSWRASHIVNNPGNQIASGLLGSLNGSPEVNKEFLDRVTDQLYESYRNPESLNFLNEIVNPNSSGLSSEIENVSSSLEAGIGATGVSVGGLVTLKQTVIDPLIKGGVRTGRGGLITAGVSALLLLDSYVTNFAGKGINKLSRVFYDNYLENNIAKPFILSKVTDESVIRIVPLIKGGKPLISGGYEKVSEAEKWKYIYGNFYNNMSDGYRGYLKEKKKLHAEGARILNNMSDYSFTESAKINVVNWISSETLPLTAYFFKEE